MNKKRLEEYRSMTVALESIRKDLRKYAGRVERAEGHVITDVAKGSSPEFPYLPSRMKIESIDNTTGDKWARLLREREAEYEKAIEEVEEWVDHIDDPLLYHIFRQKLRHGKTNAEIGEELNYSRQRIDQLINGYLQED